ncbi:hypothetical protein RhiirB3_529475 [Rhizophagus irregularis]|nr:hypothetical protein RhiirB3_529475 [Rhizophagus irregularis]
MTCKLTTLPFDCLHEIIEYFEKDRITLHSCLLVNRLLCEISVKILWGDIKDISSYKTSSLSFFNTIIACLPNESKELIFNNEIFISKPTLQSPLFNYAKFCKKLSITDISKIINYSLGNELTINQINIEDKKYLITNEVIKMFMNQASLKILTYCYCPLKNNYSFSCLPGIRNLSEFQCNSNLSSDFFHQLSQICHNLQSISISFENDISNKLKELISLQNNLKSLTLRVRSGTSWKKIIPSLTKNSNKLTKLHLHSENNDNLPLSFISLFTNLQEFKFSFLSYFVSYINIKDFEKLQHINFPKLQTLKIPYQCPKPEYLMKFLEINGKNLRRVYICEGICEGIFNTVFNPKGLNKNLILSIANFCPNLKRLSVRINSGESYNTLETIFNNCQYLEFISVWCGKKDMTGILFDIVATYSSKYFCELVLYNSNLYLINSKDLELFLISWKNRKPKKLLTLVIIRNTTIDEYEEYKGNIINDENNEDSHDELSNRDQNLKIIEEYKKLDIIKFRIENIKEEEESEYYFY